MPSLDIGEFKFPKKKSTVWVINMAKVVHWMAQATDKERKHWLDPRCALDLGA